MNATRAPATIGYESLGRYITHGASPRASINLILAGKALAFVRGRNYALPQDVRDLALDVMRHRLVLSYEALADGVRSDDILSQILHAIPLPEVPLNGTSGSGIACRICLLYTSPSPRDRQKSRMPSSA